MPLHQLRVLLQVVQAQRHGCHGDGQRNGHAGAGLQMLQNSECPIGTDVCHGRAGARGDELGGFRLAKNVDDLIRCFLGRPKRDVPMGLSLQRRHLQTCVKTIAATLPERDAGRSPLKGNA